jgi:hypothetical protein
VASVLARITVALMCLTVGLTVASSAEATNVEWNNGNAGCGAENHPDANPHTFYYEDLTSTVATLQEDVRLSIVEPTDVTTQKLNGKDFYTDVIVTDADWTYECGVNWDNDPQKNYWGQSSCAYTTNAQNHCQQYHLRYDTSDVNASMHQYFRWTIGCHETAHTLGLKHRNYDQGCLFDPITNAWANLTAHDLAHITLNW